jgi:hypothetical protein
MLMFSLVLREALRRAPLEKAVLGIPDEMGVCGSRDVLSIAARSAVDLPVRAEL